MSEDRADDVSRLAGAISDGVDVDWRGEVARRPDLEATYAQLVKLETIARASRAAGVDPAAMTVDTTEPMTPTTDPPDRLPFEHWGPLKLIERLSGGGFGDVYRAHDASLDVEVALKLWHPVESDAVSEDDFLTEARRLARVRHENVLVVHGVAKFEGRAGMWTDLLRGQTLESYLEREGPIGAREAALIGIDLCNALAAMHKAGIIHRDVKTFNVMREQGGRIVLVDFGTAAEHAHEHVVGETGTFRGTPMTMAPEQFDHRHAGAPTDIYGLGVLLYRLVTGQYPVEGSSVYEIIGKHQGGLRVPLLDLRPDLPVGFVQVVEKAIATDPAQRYASAGAMQAALAGVMGVDPGASAPHPRGAGWRDRVRIRRPQLAAAVTVAAVVVVAMILLSNRRPANVPSESADAPDRSVVESATPADPEAPAPAPPLTASVRLFRTAPQGDEPLLTGATVHPGDGLSLEIQGSDAMHVYVLSEDQNGETFVLFPLAGLDLQNPLPSGRSHRLPGVIDGQRVNWKVTSAGGEETLIVIASRVPQRGLEQEIEGFPAATRDQPVVYGRVSEEAMSTLRGIGGLGSAGPNGAAGASHLSEVLSGVSVADRSDLWLWQIQLENP